MPGISDLLGGLLGEGSIARQFLIWNVMGAVANASLTPFLTEVANKVNADHPVAPLDPQSLATMVVREIIDLAMAKDEAAKSGVDEEDFSLMVSNAGVGPSVVDLLALHNRGQIDTAQLDQGLARAGVDAEWFEIIKLLAITPPTPQEVMNALLQGQITRDEALDRWAKGGGDPTWFQSAFDSEGTAPTPDELSVMANRKIIPWDGEGPGVASFHQGFLEGPWRDKWETPYRQLAVYVPPPRTITTLVAGGFLSDQAALQAFQDTGMSADLAAAYLASAHGEKTTATKNLAVSEITALYQDQAITPDQATSMLEALGYDEQDSAFILTIQDFQRERKFLESAISRIHTLYVGYKVDENGALQALSALEVPNPQIQVLFQTWRLERAANVKHLTESQIVNAWFLELISQDEAMAELEQIGYQPHDAWTLMSLKNKGPLPNEPPSDAISTIANGA